MDKTDVMKKYHKGRQHFRKNKDESGKEAPDFQPKSLLQWDGTQVSITETTTNTNRNQRQDKPQQLAKKQDEFPLLTPTPSDLKGLMSIPIKFDPEFTNRHHQSWHHHHGTQKKGNVTNTRNDGSSKKAKNKQHYFQRKKKYWDKNNNDDRDRNTTVITTDKKIHSSELIQNVVDTNNSETKTTAEIGGGSTKEHELEKNLKQQQTQNASQTQAQGNNGNKNNNYKNNWRQRRKDRKKGNQPTDDGNSNNDNHHEKNELQPNQSYPHHNHHHNHNKVSKTIPSSKAEVEVVVDTQIPKHTSQKTCEKNLEVPDKEQKVDDKLHKHRKQVNDEHSSSNSIKSDAEDNPLIPSTKKIIPSTKVIIRLLPPKLTKEQFFSQLTDVPDYNYFYILNAEEPGISSYSSYSTLWINFYTTQDALDFMENVRGVAYNDPTSRKVKLYFASPDFALFQREIKTHSVNKLRGTLDQSEEYQEFLKKFEMEKDSKTKPVYEKKFTISEMMDVMQEKNNKLSTEKAPLVEHILTTRKAMHAKFRENYVSNNRGQRRVEHQFLKPLPKPAFDYKNYYVYHNP